MILAFEGARGIAALLVALYHIGNLSRFLAFRHLYLCVDLFFVLSGWVIGSNYWTAIREWKDVQQFVVRRSGRLIPLFFFSTIIYIAMANFVFFVKYLTIALGSPIRPESHGVLTPLIPKVTELLGVLTLTQGMGFFNRLILNGPSWSISCEFYTYLIFALGCIWLKDRARIFAFTAIFLLGAGVTILGATCFRDGHIFRGYMDVSYDFGFPRCLWSFFMGVLMFRFKGSIRVSKSWIQGLSVLAIAGLLVVIERLPALAFVFPVLSAFLVFSISTDQGLIPKVLNTRPMQLLGKRSYSIYMMHVPVTLLFWPITNRLAGRSVLFALAEDLVFVAVLVLVSGLTFRHIEDPFRRWAKRLSFGGSADEPVLQR